MEGGIVKKKPGEGCARHAQGRAVDPRALAEVRRCWRTDAGEPAEPRRRDLLIEHLHKIQDRYGHISAASRGCARARDEASLPTEVYEVATFYHHFDVVKEGEAPPPPLTVRVCDSLSCELAGAHGLMADLKRALGAGVRVIPAPCVGRCEQAPVAVVGQNPVAQATVGKGQAARPGEEDTVSGPRSTLTTPSTAVMAATGSPPSASPASATPRPS